jgi:hypothetical protein
MSKETGDRIDAAMADIKAIIPLIQPIAPKRKVWKDAWGVGWCELCYHPEVVNCHAEHPFMHFQCTMPLGHDGFHAACGARMEVQKHPIIEWE